VTTRVIDSTAAGWRVSPAIFLNTRSAKQQMLGAEAQQAAKFEQAAGAGRSMDTQGHRSATHA